MEAAVELVMLRGEEAVRATASNVEKSPVKAAGFCVIAALCMLFMLGSTTNSGSVLPVPMPRAHSHSSTSAQHTKPLDGSSASGANSSLHQVSQPSKEGGALEEGAESKKPDEDGKDEGDAGAGDGDEEEDEKDDEGDDEKEDGDGEDGDKGDDEKDEGEKEDGDKEPAEKEEVSKEEGEKEEGGDLAAQKEVAEKEDGDKGDGGKEDGDKEDGDKEDGEKEDGDKEDGDKEDGGKEDGDKEDGDKEDGDKPVGDKAEGDTEGAEKEEIEKTGAESEGKKEEEVDEKDTIGEDNGEKPNGKPQSENEGEEGDKEANEKPGDEKEEVDEGASKDGDGEGIPKAGADQMGSKKEEEEVSNEVVPGVESVPSAVTGRLPRASVSRVDTMASMARSAGMVEEGSQGAAKQGDVQVIPSSGDSSALLKKLIEARSGNGAPASSGDSSALLKKLVEMRSGNGAPGVSEEDSTQGAATSKFASFSGLPNPGLRSATSGTAPGASTAGYGAESRLAGTQTRAANAFPSLRGNLPPAAAPAGMGSSQGGSYTGIGGFTGQPGLGSERAPSSEVPEEGSLERAKVQGASLAEDTREAGALPTLSSVVAAQSEARTVTSPTIPSSALRKRPYGEVSEEQPAAGGTQDGTSEEGSKSNVPDGPGLEERPLDAKPDASSASAADLAPSAVDSEESPGKPAPATEGQQEDETLIGQSSPSSNGEATRVKPVTEMAGDVGGVGSWKSESAASTQDEPQGGEVAANSDPPQTASASSWAASEASPSASLQGEGQPNTREEAADEALPAPAAPRQAEETLSQQLPSTETLGEAAGSQDNLGAGGADVEEKAEVPGGP